MGNWAAIQALGPSRSTDGCSTKRSLSYEWVNAKIGWAGNTKSARQKCLRKKARLHNESDAHKDAEVVNTRNKHVMESTVIQQQADNLETTCAYFIAKCDRPYVDHPELLNLQKLNGINIGNVLYSNVICEDITDHIVCSMKNKIVSEIVQKNVPVSVLIDERTTLGYKSALILYLRCSVDGVSNAVSFILDLIELSDTTSTGIVHALLHCLYSYGLSNNYLENNWLGLATDGASVMLGHKGGVIAKIKHSFPNIIGWHCLNHRLELAVGDAVKSCTEINHFQFLCTKSTLCTACLQKISVHFMTVLQHLECS